MNKLLTTAVVLSLLGAVPAYAASDNDGSKDQANASGKQASLVTVNKLEQDLRNAGFTDVKVVAESFVVQAKSKDGDPILLTVGPHGMAMFEAAGAASSSSNSSSSSKPAGSSK